MCLCVLVISTFTACEDAGVTEQEWNDANSKIAKVACNMTQTYTLEETTTSMILDTEFIFSDYGTTVVDVVAE